MRGCSISFPEYLGKLIRRLEGQDYSLIIIDPFYKGMVGRDGNSASAVNPICAALDRLADQTGARFSWLTTFKGNQGKKPLIDRLVGSGVTARDADTIITLTKPGTGLSDDGIRPEELPGSAWTRFGEANPVFAIRDAWKPRPIQGRSSESGP